MKNILKISCLFIIFFSIHFYSQAQPPADINKQILKPTLLISDVYFVFQTLNTIEIKTTEVDQFLKVKTLLQGFLKLAQDQKKNINDAMVFELELGMAQSMLDYLGRATIAGNNAEIYKRFVDSIVESAKEVKKN